jgi:ABC-type transport system involved in Fe-S cluster assembly fused permease/ATPase subunit
MSPCHLQISLVAGILAYKFGAPFAYITCGTVAAYTLFTLAVTQVKLFSDDTSSECCSLT